MVFFLHYLKNGYPYHRFAVSVNKKIGNSVQRNFIKRKMKELFRTNQSLVEEKHDFWISTKKRFDSANVQEIENIFVDSLIKINYR